MLCYVTPTKRITEERVSAHLLWFGLDFEFGLGLMLRLELRLEFGLGLRDVVTYGMSCPLFFRISATRV